jgi:hypothetical protein
MEFKVKYKLLIAGLITGPILLLFVIPIRSGYVVYGGTLG